MEKAEEPTSNKGEINKYFYRQQSHSPTTMEEQVESNMAPTTNVVNDISKNLSMMDETNTTVQTKNHHNGIAFQLS